MSESASGGHARTRAATSAAGAVAVVVAMALAGLVTAAVTRAALRSALSLRASWPEGEDVLGLPPSRVLHLLGLGHDEAAADLVAARANVAFGARLGSDGDQIRLARSLETAVDLDPGFHRLYLRGAAMLVYAGRAFTVDAFLAADHLLARGSVAFPGDWELPFQRGFNLLFELPKLVSEDDPRAADWRQAGVEALRQATLLDGAPAWLPGLAARMLTNQGGDELAIRHLEQTYAVTNDPATRDAIARQLGALVGRRRVAALAAETAALEQAIASRYPYAPESFSLLLGPRARPGVDLEALLGRQRPTSPSPSSSPLTSPSIAPPRVSPPRGPTP